MSEILPPSRPATRDPFPGATEFRLALGVFREPYAWKIVTIGLLGALAVMALLGAGVWWVVAKSGWLEFGWIARYEWTGWLVGGLGTVIYLVAGWFLFPVVFTAVAGIFLEDLADRIERRHYPELPVPRKVPVAEQVSFSSRWCSWSRPCWRRRWRCTGCGGRTMRSCGGNWRR